MTETKPLTLPEFILARVADDEAAATLVEGWPAFSSQTHATSTAKWAERATRLPSVALGFACPTCHAQQGETCTAMTPPHYAPKAAAALHGARCDLARAEIRRREGDISHRDRWNLTRVLAECEAKRRIVWQWQRSPGYDDGQGLWDALRHLATVWAEHADYRKEWRP